MSTVNLGLQCVGLSRTCMSDEHEVLASKAGSVKEIRSIAVKNPAFEE